jgi:uncharacterized membrane protein YidH (DUF202 family)
VSGRVVIAIVLIVLGVAGLATGGFSFTREKKVVDLGPLEVTKNERKTVPISPIVGTILIVSGVALLVMRGGQRA